MKVELRFHLSVCLTFCFNPSVELLKEFPEPKSLLYKSISRSLGVSDMSKLIQYSCTEHAGVKVRTEVMMSLDT